MEVLVYTRTPGPEQRHVRYTTLEQVLTQSDYLSLHCPLTDETRHIINYNALKKMKPSAFLINTARGPLVDQKALEQALLEGRLAGAGLDVQEQEPLPEDSLLYRLDNVILTPHMGWKGLETRSRLMKMLKENIMAYLLGCTHSCCIRRMREKQEIHKILPFLIKDSLTFFYIYAMIS